MKYKCKICGAYHNAKTIFYHLKENRRLIDSEINKIGLDGFGNIYKFARYCAKTKEYTLLDGFI